MGVVDKKLLESKKSKPRHWLMKTEPNSYSIYDLKKDKTTIWDGVRNYQSRNLMQAEMKAGDLVLLYHSNTKIPGVKGIACITKEAVSDPEQFNPDSKYYDPKATPEKPIWFAVTLSFREIFPDIVSLEEMKSNPRLEDMLVTRKGMRLSVQPVSKNEFREVCSMGRVKTKVRNKIIQDQNK